MKIELTEGWTAGIQQLSQRLQSELQEGKRALWLICGGSNIQASVKIMDNLEDELTKKLAILLTDERYGAVGHPDSNARQLQEAGFQTKQALFIPVLTGLPLEDTRVRYDQAMQRAIEHADIVIAQFGIGADGHIAGLLPHSVATTSTDWVAAYEAPPFTRITLTFKAMKHIHMAVAMAFGEDKQLALERLRDETLPLVEQPSQILKELPEAYVYNDQVSE
jgi:6-phosphogluconolactonase/glucosamine-6-phosphate isomerase/deaminase